MSSSPPSPPQDSNQPTPDPVPPPVIDPSSHAKLRSRQGRPISRVINDVQRAGPHDVFVQPADGRYVIRGPNAREHIIEPDGDHVTSIQPRADAAHKARLRSGTIRPATTEEFEQLKSMAQ